MNQVTQKVLVVAYFFPPAGGAGVQRPLKFVKYLKRLGWEPYVLTAKNPSVPTMDEGLLKDLPPNIKIYTASTLEPSYAKKTKLAGTPADKASYRQKLKNLITRFFIPDMQILWWPSLIVQLVGILRRDRPNVILVTAPPFSSFIPVVIIGKVFRIPVVVDFRDEWIFARSNIENAGRGKVIDFFDFWLERLTVSLCHNITAATQSYVDSIRQRHHSATGDKGIAIPNGYDEDDFKELQRTRQPDGKFRILYTGTVWKATSLKPFCQAVKSLVATRPELKEVLSIKIIGRIVESELISLDPLEKMGVIDILGYCSHEQVLQEMVNADLLLLTLSDLPGAEKIIPGKLFEYLASGIDILSIVPDGETEKILNNTTAFKVIPPQCIDLIGTQISNHIDCVVHKTRPAEPANLAYKMYSRSELTSTLSVLLKSIIQGD